MKKLLLCLLVASLAACMPPEVKDTTTINTDIQSEIVQHIYDWQDEQRVDSLLYLLQSEEATDRYWAARAFASINDATVADSLVGLLNDEVEAVRIAAAYSLGQLDESSVEDQLIGAFEQSDTAGIHQQLNATILEAVGKSASEKYLDALSTIKTYQKSDTILLEGQAWGIYRYMLRGMTTEAATRRMLALATDSSYPNSARFVAANYLLRGANLGLDTIAIAQGLNAAFRSEKDVRIRMPLAIALGKTQTPEALSSLFAQLTNETDYRVRCNIIRAFRNFEYSSVIDTVLVYLHDKNLHVALTATNYLLDDNKGKGEANNATTYRRMARDTTLQPMVQVGLLKASNRHLAAYFTNAKNAVNYTLQKRYEEATNREEKAEILRALGYNVRMYRYIADIGLATDDPLLRSASAEAIQTICKNANYDNTLRSSRRRITREIGDYLLQSLQTGDAGTKAVAAAILRIPARDFKTVLVDSLSVIEGALTALELPKQIETYNELQKTVDYFKEQTERPARKTDYNHPIDWKTLSGINPNTRATIQTNKGDITLELFSTDAPGSVVNFIRLAKEGFYDSKTFHRVIPNFVIQGGCPIGNGYGSLDYSIRSELAPLKYDQEGYVGMASAGNHTEGTQFFITHSPTPHLDGRYTIFAKVVEGMETVHKIQVGDIIRTVTLSDYLIKTEEQH